MKWLFRFFLFTCILFTTGSGLRSLAFSPYKTNFYANFNQVPDHSNQPKFTPVNPERDCRVFQLAEDEEDDLPSRIKKVSANNCFILTFFYTRALIFHPQSNVNNQSDTRLLSLNSHHRYIQLRSIRI